MSLSLKKLILPLLASISLFTAACTNDNSADANQTLVNGNEIELSYVAWDDLVASTNVIGTVLEDVGYDVTLTSLDNVFMWQSVASGEADAMVGGSLPNTHGAQYEEYGDQMELVNTSLTGSVNALTVPSYMDVDSIEDLTYEADQTILGIEPGGGIMKATEQVMEDYDNLSDWELQSSSSGAMVTELRTALQNEEEIVVTGWEPHWKFLEFDLKMLEDPKKSFGGEQTINTLVREGLEEDEPFAYSVLSNFEWTQEDIKTVMLDIQEGIAPADAARNWIEDNQDIVEEWTAEAEEMAAS